MLHSLVKDLYLDHRRRLVVWLAVAVGWLILSAVVYPQLAGSAWVLAVADAFSVQAKFLLAFWVVAAAAIGLPLITSLYAIWEGSNLFAGKQVRTGMYLLLAYPLSRWVVFLSRLVYLFLTIAALSWVMTLGMALAANLAAAISVGNMLSIQPGINLFAFLAGSLVILIATLNGSLWKTRLIGLLVLLAFYAPYLIQAALGIEFPLLVLSPLYLALGDLPLLLATPVWKTILLLGLVLVVIGIASLRFERMDLE
jgi:ABC-type transport system involved in multi-copper enzyme maturation permease subunit